MSYTGRIFIGINLDQKAKQFISKKVAGIKWKDESNLRFVDPENYHLTLMFLGVLRGEDIVDICLKLREALKKSEVFDLEFEEFVKAPSKKNPKMVWLAGKENKELTDLKNKIETALMDCKTDAKKFSPHITIARAKKGDLSQEEISQKARLLAPVESVEVLESVMEQGKRRYLTLETIPLK